MALFGRRFPIRPHLAGPLVAQPAAPPLATSARVVALRQNPLRQAPKAHLAPAIVNRPPLSTRPYVVTARGGAAVRKGYVRLAPPVAGPPPAAPLWTRAYIVRARSDRRPAFPPRLAAAIIAPAPQAPAQVDHVFVLSQRLAVFAAPPRNSVWQLLPRRAVWKLGE